MSRPEGLPKTGGRKSGTPNKRTTLLVTKFQSAGFDPVDQLIDLIPSLPPLERSQVLLSLLPYLYPRRKPSDLIFEPADMTDLFGTL